jgi:hypothetical protein
MNNEEIDVRGSAVSIACGLGGGENTKCRKNALSDREGAVGTLIKIAPKDIWLASVGQETKGLLDLRSSDCFIRNMGVKTTKDNLAQRGRLKEDSNCPTGDDFCKKLGLQADRN